MTAPETLLGKYRLERKLGAGGMGEVWEARDIVLDRAVAIKLLTGDAADREHYVREAAAAARVSHPNTVTVHDATEVAGRWFIVMELVRGPNAAQLVEQRGRLPWPEATRIIRDAAAGLAAVHAAGLIHRDIKPGNILLNEQGQAKIADFGLARHTARTSLTTTGSLLGTPHFMGPEQCQGEPADTRSDIYALGATYYALLTAHPPFDGENQMAIMFAHCNSPVPDPRKRVPDLPEGCAAIVRRAMAKQPADRFPTAEAMHASLDDALAGVAQSSPTSVTTPRLPPATVVAPPVRTRRLTRRAWLAAAPAALAGLAGAAYLGWRPRRDDANAPTPLPPWVGGWDIGKPVMQLAIAPDERAVAIAAAADAEDGNAFVDLRDRAGKSLKDWPKPGRGAEGVAFSPDGKLLAAAFRGWGRIKVWELDSGREVFDEDYPMATAVGFSSDGQWLAATAYDDPGARVQFWRRLRRDAPGSWWRKDSVTAAASQVWGFAFAPGTDLLVVAGGTGDRADLEVFSAEKGAKVAGPEFKARRASKGPSLAFAAQASLLAVGSLGDVKLFGVPDWLPRGNIPVADRGSDMQVVALSASGSLLAAGQGEKVLLFLAREGKPLGNPTQHAGPVSTLAFSPDGQTLITGGEDGTVHIVDLKEMV